MFGMWCRECWRYPLPNPFSRFASKCLSHYARAVPVPLRTLARPAREGAERLRERQRLQLSQRFSPLPLWGRVGVGLSIVAADVVFWRECDSPSPVSVWCAKAHPMLFTFTYTWSAQVYVNGSVINTVRAASNPTPTFSHYARAVPVPHGGRELFGGTAGSGGWMGCGC